jgi:hypothetical protein
MLRNPNMWSEKYTTAARLVLREYSVQILADLQLFVFFNPSTQILGLRLEWSHDCFLPHLLQFTVHESSCNAVCR